MPTALQTIAETAATQWQALLQHHPTLFKSALPDAKAAHDSPMQQHLASYQELSGQALQRQLATFQGLAKLAWQPSKSLSLMTDSAALGVSVLNQVSTQQALFIQAIGALMADVALLKKANTLSKLMDQESDISGRLHSLITTQATANMELLENIQINLGYLVAQAAHPPESAN